MVSARASKAVTTTFVDDAAVVQRDESKIAHVDDSLTDLQDPQATPDNVISFLGKPIVLTRGNFSTTDVYTIFDSYNLPSALFTSTEGEIWKSKLHGFFGIRFDIRVKLVVNANKFQQGRYILGWTPLASPTPTTSNLKQIRTVYAHNSSLVQRTTVPHVELDLATNTSAEMLIPFVSVDSFYPINNIIAGVASNSLGYLSLYPYSPMLSPVGSTVANYTIYVSLENVKLFGSASAQAGISDREVSNKSNGPISGVANAVSRGFKEFGNIPLIGDYASGISWISDRISKTASIFGFSKPTAGDSIGKVQLMNAPSHSTVDGDSDSKALSFLNKPGVLPVQGLSGTEYDEMDFSFIKSKYAYFQQVNWLDSHPAQTLLASISVRPSVGELSTTVSGQNFINFTPVAFLSKPFRLWRGSLRFRFKLVKTEFHSGRLMFAFYPTTGISYTGNSSYVNRLIVDIREKNEVELIIPYLSQTPWKEANEATGLLYVTVVDPLVNPATVAPLITILMEISGGPDFEVACPKTMPYTPSVYVPQGYMNSEKANTAISEVIGNTEIKSNSVVHTSMTIGDKVSSVRSFIKRFVPIESTEIIAGSTLNTYTWGLFPDAIIMHNGTPSVPVFCADLISMWASCYALMSGGIRIRNILNQGLTNFDRPDEGSSNSCYLVYTNVNRTRILFDAVSLNVDVNDIRVFSQNVNNTITVEVPQYTKTYSRAVSDLIIFQDSIMPDYHQYQGNSSNTQYALVFATTKFATPPVDPNRTAHNLYRAGADDFNLSCFISIPPMIVTASYKHIGFGTTAV